MKVTKNKQDNSFKSFSEFPNGTLLRYNGSQNVYLKINQRTYLELESLALDSSYTLTDRNWMLYQGTITLENT